MTINEAFRNRGLLTSEWASRCYRVTYGRSKYLKNTVIFRVMRSDTAAEELREKWERYAGQQGIPADCVMEIQCIPEALAG